jgi:hypothetical protein
MIQAQTQIKLNMVPGSHQMNIGYTPKTDRTVFDICDINGRVVKTGQIREDRTTIELTDLKDDNYILLILDGDRVASCKFSLAR